MAKVFFIFIALLLTNCGVDYCVLGFGQCEKMFNRPDIIKPQQLSSPTGQLLRIEGGPSDFNVYAGDEGKIRFKPFGGTPPYRFEMTPNTPQSGTIDSKIGDYRPPGSPPTDPWVRVRLTDSANPPASYEYPLKINPRE